MFSRDFFEAMMQRDFSVYPCNKGVLAHYCIFYVFIMHR